MENIMQTVQLIHKSPIHPEQPIDDPNPEDITPDKEKDPKKHCAFAR